MINVLYLIIHKMIIIKQAGNLHLINLRIQIAPKLMIIWREGCWQQLRAATMVKSNDLATIWGVMLATLSLLEKFRRKLAWDGRTTKLPNKELCFLPSPLEKFQQKLKRGSNNESHKELFLMLSPLEKFWWNMTWGGSSR